MPALLAVCLLWVLEDASPLLEDAVRFSQANDVEVAITVTAVWVGFVTHEGRSIGVWAQP